MKEFLIKVSQLHNSNGTCGARGCRKWGSTSVSYERQRVALCACSNDHVMAVAHALVEEYVPRNVKRFKVTLYRERVEVHRGVFASKEFVNERK